MSKNLTVFAFFFFFACHFHNVIAENIFDYNIVDVKHTVKNFQTMNLSGMWEYKESNEKIWSQINIPSHLGKQGTFIFRKLFKPDSGFTARSYQLYFKSINGACSLFLNGNRLSSHTTAAAFYIDLNRDDILINQQNELIIQLDNRLNYKNTVPLKVSRNGLPISGSGIHRDIFLTAFNTPGIGFLHVFGAEKDSTNFHVFNSFIPEQESKIKDKSSRDNPIHYNAILYKDHEKKPVWSRSWKNLKGHIDENNLFKFSVPIEQSYIRQDGIPSTYHLKLTLLNKNEIIQQADIPLDLTQLLPQSKNVKSDFYIKTIKAVEWIDDITLHQLDNASLKKQIDQDLKTICELNANTVRIISEWPPEYLLNSCDSLGLRTLIEIPVVNVPPDLLSNLDFSQNALKVLSDFIKQFKVHPSVLAWGLGSGFDVSDEKTINFLQKLSDQAKKHDNRPLYAGVKGYVNQEQSLPVDFQILDVNLLEKKQPLSKNHLPTLYQLTSPLTRFNKDYALAERNQAQSLKTAVRQLLDSDSSAFVYSPLRDWKSETPFTFWGIRKNPTLYLAGLVDLENRKRPAFGIIQTAFSEKPFPEILPAVDLDQQPITFQLFGLTLFLLFLALLKSDRRLRGHLRRIFMFPHGFYTDLVENRWVNPFLTGSVGVTAILTVSLILSSFIYFFRTFNLFDAILTWIFADPVMKYQVIWIIWHPIVLIITISFLILFTMLLHILLFKLIVFIQKRFLKLSKIITFIFWVPANFIFALPLAIIMFHLLNNHTFILPSFLLLSTLLLWFLGRSIRGAKVILQLSTFSTILLFFAVLLVFGLSFGLYLEHSRSLLAFVDYYARYIKWPI